MNIQQMMQQAKKLQEELKKKQQQFEAKEFKLNQHGIELVMTGKYTIKSLKIDPKDIDFKQSDAFEDLADLLSIAFNQLSQTITKEQATIMSPNLPKGAPW